MYSSLAFTWFGLTLVQNAPSLSQQSSVISNFLDSRREHSENRKESKARSASLQSSKADSLPTLTDSLGETQRNQRLGLIVGICVCTSRYGTWRMVNRDRRVTDMQLRVIIIWSTQIRKPPSNPWIVCTNTEQVAVVWVCPVSKDIFLPSQWLSRCLPFRHFNPLTLLLQFRISEPPIWRANSKSNSWWRKSLGWIQDWQF